MELQYHPASGRRAVSLLSIGPRGERVLVAAAGVAAVLFASLLYTAPIVLTRAARRADSDEVSGSLGAERKRRARADGDLAALAARAGSWGDTLTKAAFLYGLPPSRWPRALDPARDLLDSPDAARAAETLPVYLAGLERARSRLAEAEAADPGLAARTPAIAPIANAVFEPAVYFGPRVSPWTGRPEFFAGLDLASAEGADVVAPADGVVLFTGRPRRDLAPRLWQFGTVVVLSHGARWTTAFGHLARADVRRGQRLRRGDRIGTVGKSGWALSPRLHYELWLADGKAARPTDPLFAILDRRVDKGRRSLEQMLATSAPEPAEALPSAAARPKD